MSKDYHKKTEGLKQGTQIVKLPFVLDVLTLCVMSCVSFWSSAWSSADSAESPLGEWGAQC